MKDVELGHLILFEPFLQPVFQGPDGDVWNHADVDVEIGHVILFEPFFWPVFQGPDGDVWNHEDVDVELGHVILFEPFLRPVFQGPDGDVWNHEDIRRVIPAPLVEGPLPHHLQDLWQHEAAGAA